MSTSLYLLFNHELTLLQEKEALLRLGVEKIYNPPSELKDMWRRIPPDLETIDGYLAPIKEWLRARGGKGDYVLIEGDFGACFIMVNFAMEHGLIPIYSTTEREAVEERGDNGTVKIVHYFRHRTFRRYGV